MQASDLPALFAFWAPVFGDSFQLFRKAVVPAGYKAEPDHATPRQRVPAHRGCSTDFFLRCEIR